MTNSMESVNEVVVEPRGLQWAVIRRLGRTENVYVYATERQARQFAAQLQVREGLAHAANEPEADSKGVARMAAVIERLKTGFFQVVVDGAVVLGPVTDHRLSMLFQKRPGEKREMAPMSNIYQVGNEKLHLLRPAAPVIHSVEY